MKETRLSVHSFSHSKTTTDERGWQWCVAKYLVRQDGLVFSLIKTLINPSKDKSPTKVYHERKRDNKSRINRDISVVELIDLLKIYASNGIVVVRLAIV